MSAGPLFMKVIAYPFSIEEKDLINTVILEKEGTIVYPTETFYALGCAATQTAAVSAVYKLKQRPRHLPLLVLIQSWEMLFQYVDAIPHGHLSLLREHWPGALTAILPHNGQLPKELNVNAPTVGFRMTSSTVAQALIELIGVPLVGTSANRTSEKEVTNCSSARSTFGNEVDLYIDGGESPGGFPSTLVDLTGERCLLVREGAIRL